MGIWIAQSFESSTLDLGSGHDLEVMGSSSILGSGLSRVSLGFPFSLSLCPSPPTCSLINLFKIKILQCVFKVLNILFIYLFFKIFYLFMIVTEREKDRDIGRGRSRLHAPGARCGIRSRVSRIAPWAKGRRQTAAPPRDPCC